MIGKWCSKFCQHIHCSKKFSRGKREDRRRQCDPDAKRQERKLLTASWESEHSTSPTYNLQTSQKAALYDPSTAELCSCTQESKHLLWEIKLKNPKYFLSSQRMKCYHSCALRNVPHGFGRRNGPFDEGIVAFLGEVQQLNLKPSR